MNEQKAGYKILFLIKYGIKIIIFCYIGMINVCAINPINNSGDKFLKIVKATTFRIYAVLNCWREICVEIFSKSEFCLFRDPSFSISAIKT